MLPSLDPPERFAVLAHRLQFVQDLPLIEAGAVGLHVLLVMSGPLQAAAWDHGRLDGSLTAAMQRLQHRPDSGQKERDQRELKGLD